MEKQYIDRSKLNEILRLLNLNYTQLGKLMGVSHQAVYRKMRGAEFTEREIQFLVEKFGNNILIK